MKKMNKRGVTLIELVVVIAIIAIGALLLVPNMGPWIQSYRLRSATRDITSTLRVAQMRAVSNNMDYRVSFDTANRSYVLERNSGGWVIEGAQQNLPTGIEFPVDALPTNNPLTFSPNSSSNGGTVVLRNTRDTRRTIRVLPSTGRITSQ